MASEQSEAVSRAPSHSCPRYVSTRLRKLFAAKGWPLHKMTGRYHPFGGSQTGTEGFSVSKVGCSKSVSIHYQGGYAYGGTRSLPAGVARARVREAVEYLRSLGYRVSDIGWIECDGHDDCDR